MNLVPRTYNVFTVVRRSLSNFSELASQAARDSAVAIRGGRLTP